MSDARLSLEEQNENARACGSLLRPVPAYGVTWASGYGVPMAASVDFTIAFEPPDEAGWIVARVLEVPGAMSQGRTREEARENALDALRMVLTPDEELAGQMPKADRELLRFTAA